MIDFYRLPSNSPNMRKVGIMLAETGLPFTSKHIERAVNGRCADAYRAISPNCTAPAIVDNETGATVFESAAVLCYLAEKAGKFLPASLRARGDVLKWLMFESANVGPVMVELHHHLLHDHGDGVEARLQRLRDRMARFCAILNEQLAGRDYLTGEYSIADMALFPWTATLEDLAEISLESYPNLKNWVVRVAERPAVRGSVQ